MGTVMRQVLDEYAARGGANMPQRVGASGDALLDAYYEFVCSRFRDDNGNELYGEGPSASATSSRRSRTSAESCGT